VPCRRACSAARPRQARERITTSGPVQRVSATPVLLVGAAARRRRAPRGEKAVAAPCAEKVGTAGAQVQYSSAACVRPEERGCAVRACVVGGGGN